MPTTSISNFAKYAKELKDHGLPIIGVMTSLYFDTKESYAKLEPSFISVIDVNVYKTVIAEAKNDTLIPSLLRVSLEVKSEETELKVAPTEMPETKQSKKKVIKTDVSEDDVNAALNDILENE